ncbi:PIN domain-containing protein [Nodularia spumigena CS-584]|jgi:predicted nucleic acid-binding protein|uniref:type II toxin-antitoxin system VapC family toxin n=1 Tax=Nodularia spumigena TaxID=70799 RepID=UPI0000EACF04|nr:PIN domain-containing protein [Nodularia spumigena]AHJ28037.1 PilT protein-like protein [Nodularia spumigena CCY9414]EAW44288.1 PilT protein-like protein [Nodularia spumigena CCY9414]MDB9382440.1 PIN domain-containing protein [Nodularia spumigena CS-584]MEA5555820.1 PIN domain-containing protein [Nodularia spumigena CH309]
MSRCRLFQVGKNPLALDVGRFKAVVSPITLSECLVGAMRSGLADLEQAFLDVLLSNEVVFVDINAAIAQDAARIRLLYNLQLPDALQIAIALTSNCDAFLTNDQALKRVTELRILVVSELEVD